MRIRSLALVAPLLIAGCREAAERVFTPPRVEFRGADVSGVGIGGSTLDVVLRLHNSNPYALTATGARYRVLAGDSTEVGRGSTSAQVTVGAGDSADVRLPIELSWEALGKVGRGAARAGRITYRVVGEVDARTPIGTRAIPIDASGSARAPRIFR